MTPTAVQSAPPLDALPLTVTTFENVKAQEAKAVTATWGAIVSELEQPGEYVSKGACPLFNMCTFGEQRTPKGSLRHDANVLTLTGIVGDYDGEQVSITDAAQRLHAAGIEAALYTSASHTDARPRWRVAAPLSKPHSPAEHSRLLDVLNGALGGILNGESWTRSQSYYIGRVAGVPYRCERSEGACLDDVAALELVQPIGKARAEKSATPAPMDTADPFAVADRQRRLVNVTAATLAELESALAWLAAKTSRAAQYKEWIDAGEALASLKGTAFEAQAEAAWHKFSATAADKYDAQQAREKWASFTPGRITYASIFEWAQQAGWQNPAKKAAPAPAAPFKPAPRSARHLIGTEFKPVMFTIENLLPEGVFLLVASPKVGKSWLSLQFALAVGSGGAVLGEQAKQGDVLVLALEDNDRRLKSRLVKLDAGMLPPEALDRLQFETQWPRVDAGGAELIAEWLRAHPEARLVVVDVLERIRPTRDAKANAYGEDYMALQALKTIAEQHRVSVLVVHHTRKAASDDPMQLVSGTQGLAGAADGVLILSRARGEAQGELTVMARDLEREGSFAVQFSGARWSMIGPAGQVAKTALQRSILEALKQIGEPAGPKQVAELLGKSRQAAQQALSRMVTEGLLQCADGRYSPSKHIDHVDRERGIASVDCVDGVDRGKSLSTSSTVNMGQPPAGKAATPKSAPDVFA